MSANAVEIGFFAVTQDLEAVTCDDRYLGR